MPESALRQLVPQSAEPFVRSYNPFNPAFRETMRASISDLLGGRAMGGTPTQRYRANIADMLTGAVEMAPGVGEAVGVTDTRQAIRSGDYGTAAMLGGATALGMVPVIGDAASRAIREGLDMSQAARMQRAQEQSYLPETVYHGTRSDISEFSVQEQVKKQKSDAPPGVYFFSSNPRVAGSYSGASRSPSGAANIIPAKLRMENPLIIDAKGNPWSEIDITNEIMSTIDPRRYPSAQNKLPDGSGKDRVLTFSINDLASIARQTKKYDGIIVKNVQDSGNLREKSVADTYAVFDPSNIRSINAAFDPEKRGSANLMAGVGGVLAGGSALRALLPQEQERQPD